MQNVVLHQRWCFCAHFVPMRTRNISRKDIRPCSRPTMDCFLFFFFVFFVFFFVRAFYGGFFFGVVSVLQTVMTSDGSLLVRKLLVFRHFGNLRLSFADYARWLGLIIFVRKKGQTGKKAMPKPPKKEKVGSLTANYACGVQLQCRIGSGDSLFIYLVNR